VTKSTAAARRPALESYPMRVPLVFCALLSASACVAAAETPAAETKSKDAKMSQAAPAKYKAKFETSQGVFVIEVHRDWAPLGADRFHELVQSGYYDGVRFFRVLDGFMAQFGIHGDPKVAAQWREKRIQDDPVKQSNTRGMVTYAMAGPNTRTTQIFINYADNSRLDDMRFAPFGKVIEGMEVVDRLYAEYGEGAPRGAGPDQGRMQAEGNAYLTKDFPNLDWVKTATIVK